MIVCCLSLSFASGILVIFIILVILVIPLTVPLDINIDIDIVVIRLLELISLRVFLKLLIDDCDEDGKEVLRLVSSEDVDDANGSDQMNISQSKSCCSWKDNYTMVIR